MEILFETVLVLVVVILSGVMPAAALSSITIRIQKEEEQLKDFFAHLNLETRKTFLKQEGGGKKFPLKDYEIWNPHQHHVSFENLKGNPLIVKFKTLSKSFPYVVCWEKNCVLVDDIQVIELKNMELS